MLLQIIFSWAQFLLDVFGTNNGATILVGFLFNVLGVFLSAMGKVTVTKENVTPTPDPNPTALTFVYTNKKTRMAGSFILIFFCMAIFAPSFKDMRLLISFAFFTGLLNYLLTDGLLNWGVTLLTKITRIKKQDIINEVKEQNNP